ncbi:MAG: alpha-amylase [Melioribacteraceae bacterium]|nr:alpha-amylase [Melioribacteraceae bacterium]
MQFKNPKWNTFFIIVFAVLIGCQSSATKQVEIPVSNVKHPDWTKNATIYEANIRQYTEAGTFNAFAEELPKLKEMGVDIIWLMPIHPVGELNRKGTLGSYYSVKDYKGVNPEFGTLEDFKNLVDKTHELGMFVIIDWVANHTSWDNEWTKTNPEYFTKDDNGNFAPPVEDWSDVIYENKEVWPAMIDALEYWVKECNIDGYRCDVASMVPVEFWDEARIALNKSKHVFMLAEASEQHLQKNAFDMTYSWQLKDIMNEIAEGKKCALDLDEFFAKELQEYTKNDYRMTFTTNHDENSWNGTVFERLGEGVETFAVFSNIIPGMPLVYSGQEAGNTKRLEFFEKDPIQWKDSKFREIFTKLFKLKHENKALWNGTFGGEMLRVNTNDDKNIFAVVREKDNNKVFAIFNLSGNDIDLEINDPNIAGDYQSLFENKDITLGHKISKKILAWDYEVFYK